VDEKSSITTVINKNIGAIAVGPGEHFVSAFPVFHESLSLPSKYVSGLVLGNGSGGVVLGGVDVAGSPSEVSTEFLEGLDENGSLDSHMQRTRNLGTLEYLIGSVLLSEGHHTWHLDLSDLDFLVTVVGKLNVSNLVFVVLNHL